MTDAPLKLFNSLTRSLEPFEPIHPGEARVYTCGPTVYNYQHIGNMRAYVFADTLGRTLSWKGYALKHVINITDVGHLTSDADAGDDKMEKAAAREGKSAWDIARYYQQVFEADLDRLNIRKPQHPRATDYVESMIAWARSIEVKHCYELDSGLYFDVATVPEYGRLARAVTDAIEDAGEGRIDEVEGKHNAADFAIWRKTPPGETRQMEWDSPWGKGAPGWHLECSVMSAELLGHPFDIHTGGIDHREIHHPNEIAQNQAHNCSSDSGARIWMHNNFLIDRRGKMSKSSGEFLTLQALVDRGFHPLAYRLLCLQAHYRSELEFTWEGLEAALTRLKRIVGAYSKIRSADVPKDFQETSLGKIFESEYSVFTSAISDDLATPKALTAFEELLTSKHWKAHEKAPVLLKMDRVLGFGLATLTRADLRIRPATAEIIEAEIEAALSERKEARAAKDFARSDAIRDDLAAKGVEVMDGDPLGWEWKLS
ncbi:cysteine--tRNA ligase [Parerythrobacter jejuensis]|uniref:Cysteine--tRNA ligase n=1 Tax=Parerythrobacter jejuensis TaxID=795812 RepID=A0A845APS4_9SPHN|nr:cysteine--tRNA ligase [Parerythrobacter jejuensis]MXP32842.1 cysteine--tRNA ligase [Parerythrobacter jejuensis]